MEHLVQKMILSLRNSSSKLRKMERLVEVWKIGLSISQVHRLVLQAVLTLLLSLKIKECKYSTPDLIFVRYM